MALCLQRKLGESIMLQTNDGLNEVTVAAINGGKIGLRTEAPQSVRIWRKESPRVLPPGESDSISENSAA